MNQKSSVRGTTQSVSGLLTADTVRLLDVMAERTLDQLLFGNGEGADLARAIRYEALATYRDWERRQPWAKRQ